MMNNATKKQDPVQENTTKNKAKPANSVTPMMQQYIDIKKDNQDYLLFYRMGDFYELFMEDAIIAAKELDIVLTKRGKNDGDDIPMCGVPHHSYESYLNRLIKKGYKVAICEQVETPEEAKKKRGYKAVVKREVTKIVTQGTLTDEKMLDKDTTNNLVSITETKNGNFAIAWCDISRGEVLTNEIKQESITSEMERISPAEIILCDELLGRRDLKIFIDIYRNIITSQNKSFFNTNRASDKIRSYFDLKDLNILSNISKEEINALGALIEYIEITQLDDKPNLSLPKSTKETNFLEIDASTFRNLEIFRNSEGKHQGSLLHTLNKTKTSSGARLLHNILAKPLKNPKKIEERLDSVEFLINNQKLLETIEQKLSQFSDIERIVTRLHSNKGTPRDLALLRDSLMLSLHLSELFEAISTSLPSILRDSSQDLNKFEKLLHLIRETIIEFPPINPNAGGFIKEGFNAKLDDYRNIREKSEEIQANLLEKYRQLSGITNLKIKSNNVIGTFLETNPNNIDKIPDSFIHRQTLANCVRYTTSELQEIENKIIHAESYAIAIENEIFLEVKNKIVESIDGLRKLSSAISLIDVICNFSRISIKRGYTKPTINNSNNLHINNGRHPVVEMVIKQQNSHYDDIIDFHPNSLNLNKDRIWLLTGPNMSGKSTFLRQNALICIMAQIGCYIPAEQSEIGVIDKIFSRVGASDNLSKGQSTFMVEMNETAFILNNATAKSFVILDEIGRGTSTFDGLSIAWATLEHLNNTIKCRGLFATHYHEITTLSKSLKNIDNYTLKTQEWNDEIIFKHEVVQGAAGQSYGIHVAKLAGLPKDVIEKAKNTLSILQKDNKDNSGKIINSELPLFKNDSPPPKAIEKEPANIKHEEIIKLISETEINNFTPIQALNFLDKIKSEI